MAITGDYSYGQGDISFTLRGGNDEVLASYHGDSVYYAASTIKLAVAMAVIQEVEKGRLSWDRTVPTTHEFISARGGTFSLADDPDECDTELDPVGTPISVHDLVEVMIDRSSNDATDMLLGLIGIPRVQQLCRTQGMSQLHIERQIGDLAARDQGLPNEVTTDDLSDLMFKAVHGTWCSPQGRAFLRGALSRQRYAVISDVLPQGMPWGSKSGSVTGIEHDVAFIGDPDGDHLLTLAICTRGYEAQPAKEAIRAVASAALAGKLA